VEMTINVAGPLIDGYLDWLKRHNDVSSLYCGKNACAESLDGQSSKYIKECGGRAASQDVRNGEVCDVSVHPLVPERELYQSNNLDKIITSRPGA
jgi:hypothetical protein